MKSLLAGQRLPYQRAGMLFVSLSGCKQQTMVCLTVFRTERYYFPIPTFILLWELKKNIYINSKKSKRSRYFNILQLQFLQFLQLKSMQVLIGCENWLPVLFQSVLQVTQNLVLAQIGVPRNLILIFRRAFPFSLHYKTFILCIYIYIFFYKVTASLTFTTKTRIKGTLFPIT